jgi:regulator of replication initiation timing
LQEQLDEQSVALAELDTKYKETVAQLEMQKGQNVQLDSMVNAQLAQLESQKNQIAELIRGRKDYKSAMANFDKQKKEYLAQIEDLKKQVGILTEQNTQLSEENQQLNSSLGETQSKLKEESAAKASLASEKSNLEAERNKLSKKVDIASAIRVKNIVVKGVDVKGTKERAKSRAKKVDRLSVCFRTEANEVAPQGEETFYLRIIDPSGSPLSVDERGSGVAQNKRSDEEFRYTTVATCDYSNEETDVCGTWEPGQNFAKGKYKVEVYNKGYLVGTGSFNLK